MNMKRRLYTVLLLTFLSTLSLCAQGKFFTGSGLNYVFDNHEFARSHNAYIPSETIHFVRVTNLFGWTFVQSENLTYNLVFGADLVKQMGTKVGALRDIVDDIPIFFESNFNDGNKTFTAVVGSYPRKLVKGLYSELLMSEETLETDFNLDGAYLGYSKGGFTTELALDWMGKYGNTRKERFQILSYGSWNAIPALSLGWAGSFYHYAGSVQAPGVVDNHHLQAFIKYDFAAESEYSELSLKLSALGSYQRERLLDDLRLPFGGEIEAKAQWKSFGFRNVTSYTEDMLPFYDWTDSAGNLYGDMLYRGSKFYKGFYDLTELYWAPRITRRLDVKLSLRYHWGREGLLGSEQRFSLLFDIL